MMARGKPRGQWIGENSLAHRRPAVRVLRGHLAVLVDLRRVGDRGTEITLRGTLVALGIHLPGRRVGLGRPADAGAAHGDERPALVGPCAAVDLVIRPGQDGEFQSRPDRPLRGAVGDDPHAVALDSIGARLDRPGAAQRVDGHVER